MCNELIVKTNLQEYKVFFQNGFYNHTAPTKRLHIHNYAEIHIVTAKKFLFSIGDRVYSLNKGSIFVVPRGVFHCCIDKDETSLHTAFQIDYDINKFSINNIKSDTILEFFHEIDNCKISQDYTKIAAYITLFCSYVFENKKLSVQHITDHSFLIREFFSNHYGDDIHLCDLASILHVSERQAERLVIKHTGNSFKNELISTRMNMAKKLLESSDMTLGQIAQYVGYQSYTGFWKAMKKYNI